MYNNNKKSRYDLQGYIGAFRYTLQNILLESGNCQENSLK